MVTDRPTVLVVDDEVEIAELMRDFLEADGFRTELAHDGASALATIARSAVDCVLLDVMLPDASGFEICRQIREIVDLPVIFLSARDTDTDKIRGLGLGADDFVVKSVTAGEVVARIKAVLRRYHRGGQPDAASTLLDFGRLRLDLAAHEVLVDGRPIAFTIKEFELLRLLAEQPRRAFSREQLYAQLWGEYGERHTVTVHVGRIREKIEIDPAKPEYIVTVWGVGYRFEGQKR